MLPKSTISAAIEDSRTIPATCDKKLKREEKEELGGNEVAEERKECRNTEEEID